MKLPLELIKKRDAFVDALDELGGDIYVTGAAFEAGALAALESEAVKGLVETLRGVECLCDARFSGSDEAEFCARGCPACMCQHIDALANWEQFVKGGEK